MLVPHFHFGGNCLKVIDMYEKAFNTKAYWICRNAENPDIIDHAEMLIHGTRVMLNDRYAKSVSPKHSCLQMVAIFKTKEKLLESYEHIKMDIIELDPLQEVSYSPLRTSFIDCFGIQWCFMIDENIER